MLQAVQALKPVDLAYVPPTHSAQAEAWTSLANVPAVQAMHGLGPGITLALPWP